MVSIFGMAKAPPLSHADRLALLNAALSGLALKHANTDGLVEAQVRVDGSVIGFSREGMIAVAALAAAIRQDRTDLRRGANPRVQAKALASEIMGAFRTRIGETAAGDDLAALEKAHDNWFATQTQPRTHIIPCDIISQPASAFSVGPVRFMMADEFLMREAGAGRDPQAYFRSLIDCLNQSGAYWVAELTVDGCEAVRSGEIADLTVDLALCGLQLIIPPHDSRRMARATARRLGPFTGSAVFQGETISGGTHVTRAAVSMAGQSLDVLVSAQRSDLDTIGRRIEVYLTGTATLSVLDQAWCDAAYWLHEGLAELLDTMAVAKLETAIEVLMRSESSSGSASRLERAMKVFFDLKPEDTLGTTTTTVKSFVKEIVGVRSRVLHGTFSTLTEDSRSARSDVETLALVLLRKFAIALDGYAAVHSPKDDLTSFLDWVAAQRAAGLMA